MIGPALAAQARSAWARSASALAIGAGLLNAGCLRSDGISCNNAGVRISIADDALTSLAETLKVPLAAPDFKVARRDYTLHDTFELSRVGDVASCRGTLGMRSGKKGLPDSSVDYSVTQSGEGNVLYFFDKLRFGPSLVYRMLLESSAGAAKASPGNGAASATPRLTPAPAAPLQLPYAADPNWSQWQR